MKFTAKMLVQTGLLLAVCIASQFFKNLSVYFTGPIVNTTIILAVLAVGLRSGILISIIAPVSAFFISGSPIMAAIPLMFPAIMGGNIILAVCVQFFSVNKGAANKKNTGKGSASRKLILGLALGSVLKAAFMGTVIVLILLPSFGDNIAAKLPKPEALPGALAAAKIAFSLTQLITALTGSVLAYLIWIPLKKYLKKEDCK